MLPVFVLADTSGSMAQEGKIDAVNAGMQGLVAGCARYPGRCPVGVAVVAFGDGEARLAMPLAPVDEIVLGELTAGGDTPLGAALALARQVIDTEAAARPDLMHPMLVLVSDGYPTDDWRGALAALDDSPAAARAERVALAIGPDASLDVLRLFTATHAEPGGNPARILRAGFAHEIVSFFQCLPLRLPDTR